MGKPESPWQPPSEVLCPVILFAWLQVVAKEDEASVGVVMTLKLRQQKPSLSLGISGNLGRSRFSRLFFVGQVSHNFKGHPGSIRYSFIAMLPTPP